nr:CoA transferase [Mesorhizobium sp.]
MSDARPLEGLFVVSIEQAVAAPLCTVRLADAGARVVKIERPEGETARHYDSAVEGMSAYFVWLNRGKESAVLDLKTKHDLALLHRMVARADVLVQNLAPGAIDRLGLSADAIAKEFPRLIAINIVGYGQDTPYAACAPTTCWCRPKAASAPSPAQRTRRVRSGFPPPTSPPA